MSKKKMECYEMYKVVRIVQLVNIMPNLLGKGYQARQLIGKIKFGKVISKSLMSSKSPSQTQS